MSKARIKVYAYLVFNELKTIDEVPKKYREAVKKAVADMEEGIF